MVRKNVRSKCITATIHQAGIHVALCVHAWGENNNKEEGSRKKVEVYYGTERRTRIHYGTEKLRLQYETKRNHTFNSSLALFL